MFDINGGELLVILLVAVIVIGPSRLPRYAEQLARLTKQARHFLQDARTRVDSELGDEVKDIDWEALDPRRYDPRRIVREALLDPEPGAASRGAATTRASSAATTASASSTTTGSCGSTGEGTACGRVRSGGTTTTRSYSRRGPTPIGSTCRGSVPVAPSSFARWRTRTCCVRSSRSVRRRCRGRYARSSSAATRSRTS
ncbi:MAG: twin-arginine translocase TatA/TatE family subunit, partial [Micrococcales bacterium]|nr:twin-arginine translocase TatA/TatE family subunit [Micrococcales bacterium]